MNGINKYATETLEEISVASVGHRSTGKPVAKARPRRTPTNLSSDFSTRQHVAKYLLDGNRDHLLAEARSEIMKQKYKVGSLNTFTSELHPQTCAQRLELEDVHFGYAESRREQVRLQEEFVMKEKALRDTQIRSIHEMGEMKESARITSRPILCTKVERVMIRYRSSLHKYRSCKRG